MYLAYTVSVCDNFLYCFEYIGVYQYACKFMHVCASVKVFIKQLGLRLAVARRRVRQLHTAGKDTSQWAANRQWQQ